VRHWVKQVELETALEQQKRLPELVDAHELVVKTAALEEAIDEWPSSMLRRIQSAHSAIILASEGGLSLSRATRDAALMREDATPAVELLRTLLPRTRVNRGKAEDRGITSQSSLSTLKRPRVRMRGLFASSFFGRVPPT
jgi:hypothetical protein